MTITARSSVLNIKPGYYPKISMVLSGFINPGNSGDTGVRGYRPLLMTPEAIRQRAYNAAYHKRKRDVVRAELFDSGSVDY
jgi:hypothetical protein